MSPQTTEFEEGKFSRANNRFLRPIRKYISCKAWLALRVSGWLCLLPIFVSICSLPGLLERLSRKGRGNTDNPKNVPFCRRLAIPLTLPLRRKGRGNKDNEGEEVFIEEVVRVVMRVCHLRPFRWSIFPRACLRQSLALYRTLNHMGYPVEFHLGVRKEAGSLTAHSWVTFEGKRVADTTRADIFRVVYSYPPNSPW